MNSRRFPTVICAALAATAAFAPAGATGNGGPMPGVMHGWEGISAGAVRYVTLPARGSTVLAAVRTRDARIVRFGSLRGSWGIPLVTWQGDTDGLSRDRRTLVLAPTGTAFRAVTRFAIVNLRKFRMTDTIALKGTYSFDALSADAKTLYLTEYRSRQDSSLYRVRAYDLVRKRLYARPVVDPKAAAEMRGSPTRRVVDALGRWVYTLYLGGRHPFVHALDTAKRTAMCIDLPWHGKQDALWRMRMSLAADGSKLILRGATRTIEVSIPRT